MDNVMQNRQALTQGFASGSDAESHAAEQVLSRVDAFDFPETQRAGPSSPAAAEPSGMESMNRTPRQRLWIALADLFLDADPELFYDNIINVVAETGFTDEQVQQILLTEVEPALRGNLQTPIGVWEGFDEQWVIERIEAVTKTPPSWWANRRSWSEYAQKQWVAIVRKRALPNQ